MSSDARRDWNLADGWWHAPGDWLRAAGVSARKHKSKRAEWNGTDWFVSFGDESSRSWDDGLRYGFIFASGGSWYSGSLHNLPVGARVSTPMPSRATDKALHKL